jgi:hypothetical protein
MLPDESLSINILRIELLSWGMHVSDQASSALHDWSSNTTLWVWTPGRFLPSILFVSCTPSTA